MKVVKSRRDSFELLPPSMRDDHFDPQAEYDEKASRYFVDRPLFATNVENSRAQTPQLNFDTHWKRRSKLLSSGDFRSQESEPERDIEINKNQVTSSTLIDAKKLMEHQELITAIMIAIKPTLTEFYCKRYTRDMIKRYFQKVMAEHEAADDSDEPVHILKNCPNYNNINKIRVDEPEIKDEPLNVIMNH